jgi:hypothetical protein
MSLDRANPLKGTQNVMNSASKDVIFAFDLLVNRVWMHLSGQATALTISGRLALD